ncbi:MFS transporter [uncultured Sphingomonas sp.]|uniref:MFS transporter n=1 Tax=uncultured Sphingomonas sp. TaxID=158754 RepID=UPI0035CAFFCE
MELRPAIGLFGIVLAAIAAQLNDAVLNIALSDVAGNIGLSNDTATWLQTLFITGQVLGMCSSPSLGIGFSFRRFALFAVFMNCFPALLMALGGSTGASVLILRFVEGVGSGFTIPLILTVALRSVPPAIRLYALAVYALTATITPNLATSFAALWIDGVQDWRFVFLQPLPWCAVAAACVWWGLPQEPPQYDRLRQFDWIGLCLVAASWGSLTIVFEQGDRLDWWNSALIVMLTALALVTLPMLVLWERVAPVPLFRFGLLARRNLLYPVVGLLVFLILALTASSVPLQFLTQTQGYKPLQAHEVTLTVALPQFVLLPLTAWILDHARVDARWINAAGYLLILVACFGAAHLTSSWNRDQFYVWELVQSVGFAFVVMPILMMATNALKPDEGPYGSALVNTPRAVAEGIGVWAMELIVRWRGGLHRDRIVDLIGQNRLTLEQLGLLPAGQPGGPDPTLVAINAEVARQTATLTAIDSYVLLGSLAVVLLIALALIPTRTYPPRIELAGN